MHVISYLKQFSIVLRCRDVTLLTKVCIVKAMVFPIVMYGCENWTIKKAECQRTDAFELWCWRRLLRVPWTARRSNQSILKEISPKGNQSWISIGRTDAEAETQILWSSDAKSQLIGKDLMLRKTKGKRREDRGWVGWMASLIQWTWIWANSGR